MVQRYTLPGRPVVETPHLIKYSKGEMVLYSDHQAEVERLKVEIATLEQWKREALAVESTWDCQAVASEIGVPLGEDIRAAILPWAREVKAELATLKANLQRLHDHMADSIEIRERREPNHES